MSRDPYENRIHQLEVKVDNMFRALGSHAKIIDAVRASHEASIRLLADASHRADSPDLSVLLASLDHDPNRPD